jgi:hypothetical protein
MDRAEPGRGGLPVGSLPVHPAQPGVLHLGRVCRPADPAQPEPAGRHRSHHRRARLPRQPARAATPHRLAPRHPWPGLPMRPPGRVGRR